MAPAIEAIRGEIQRLTTELVSDDELADSKANFTGRLPLQLESNEGVAGSIMLMERYRLGLDYLRRYPDVISAISAEEILGVAQRYWGGVPDALATAGPPLSEGHAILITLISSRARASALIREGMLNAASWRGYDRGRSC